MERTPSGRARMHDDGDDDYDNDVHKHNHTPPLDSQGWASGQRLQLHRTRLSAK